MESNVILPFLSLVLGLIGTFTKTSKDTEKGKRITIWGGIVGVLIVISAGITIISNFKQNKKNVLAKENQEIENNNQRLLSLLAVSSNFQLTNNPYLLLEFNDELNENGEPINQSESDNIRKFPGFGIKGVSYKLELNISSNKNFVYQGSEMVVKPDNSDDINSNDNLSIQKNNGASTFEYEEINFSVNYLWNIDGYRNLTELLFDLQPKREIGTLTLKRKKILTRTEFEKISNYLCNERRWLIRVFLKNSEVENTFLNLSIPIKLISVSGTDEKKFVLIPEAAIIGSPQFDPI